MSDKAPLVGILMGSDSDWPIMKQASETLESFGVTHEARVLSAHRAPGKVAEYASGAAGRGLKVLIAGAGGAAHLPGVVAAHTPLPVIGVPVAAWSLDGLDSLLAIVQMPNGVPVATVGIGRAGNAALLAVQILATADAELGRRLDEHKRRLEEKNMAADADLPRGG